MSSRTVCSTAPIIGPHCGGIVAICANERRTNAARTANIDHNRVMVRCGEIDQSRLFTQGHCVLLFTQIRRRNGVCVGFGPNRSFAIRCSLIRLTLFAPSLNSCAPGNSRIGLSSCTRAIWTVCSKSSAIVGRISRPVLRDSIRLIAGPGATLRGIVRPNPVIIIRPCVPCWRDKHWISQRQLIASNRNHNRASQPEHGSQLFAQPDEFAVCHHSLCPTVCSMLALDPLYPLCHNRCAIATTIFCHFIAITPSTAPSPGPHIPCPCPSTLTRLPTPRVGVASRVVPFTALSLSVIERDI